MVRAGDGEAGSDLGGFGPSGVKGGIVGAVAVDVGEAFPGVPDTVAVGIDEGLKTGAVAVLGAGDGIVVAAVGIGDAVPDLLDGHVGANYHFVTGAAHGVAVVSGEGENALRGLGIVVESLGEGLVERGLVGAAIEEGAGAENVKAFRQAGLHGPRPVRVRLAEGGHASVVVVGEVLDGGWVEVGHAEGGEHFLFVGNGGFTARPPGRRTGFVEADLVGEGGAGGRFRDIGRGPPVVGGLVVAVVQFSYAGGAASEAAGPLGEGAIEGVVDKGFESATDGVALRPDDDIGAGFVKLLGRGGDTADVVDRVVIDPRGLVAALGAVVVGAGRAVVEGDGAADGFDVGLRAR